MAKIAIIPPNLPFFFDFSCQTQDYKRLSYKEKGSFTTLIGWSASNVFHNRQQSFSCLQSFPSHMWSYNHIF